MGRIIVNRDGSCDIDGCMNRKQLAKQYDMSEKQLRKQLARAEIFLGVDRIITPKKIQEIIDKIGPPSIHLSNGQ